MGSYIVQLHAEDSWSMRYQVSRKEAGLFFFFFWLKWIPIHQITRNLFQHSFPPLHSWSRLRRTNRYTYQSVHLPVGWTHLYPRYRQAATFDGFRLPFLAETDTNPPTNSKSMFQHSILLLHSSSRFRQTNWYTYQWGAIRKSFLCEIWGHGICWHGRREQSTNFSQRKSYFSHIRKSFFPWYFPTIWYI